MITNLENIMSTKQIPYCHLLCHKKHRHLVNHHPECRHL